MKYHNEKSTQSEQCAKLPGPTKGLRNMPEKAALAAEDLRPDAVRPTKDVKAPDHVTLEIASAAETMEQTAKSICEASGISGERPAERILSQADRDHV